MRVHGHAARQRPGPVVQARIILRGRIPAEELVSADLRHVARPPAGPVRGGRIVRHGDGRRGGRHLARPGARLVRVVGEDRVADPHRVHGHAALDHRDLGLRLGRVPVLVPTQLGVARTRQHAGIPAVVVLRHGRQRDLLAGRIVDLASGHHVRARVDGPHGHAAVLMRGGALHEVRHLAVGLRFRGPSGVSGRVGRDGTGGILRVLVIGELVGELELHVVDQIAGDAVDGAQRLEREPADVLTGGNHDRTLERVPRAQPAIRVRSVHRGGLLTQPVAPVGRDAGHLHRLLVAGRSDEDLDLLIGVDGAVPVRVPEFHGVHGGRAVRGVDVLVQVRVGLRCGDLRVHVVVRMGPLDLDDAAAPVDPGVGLVGLPAEPARVEPVEVHPLLGRLALAVQRAADLHVAVRRVDVGEVVLVGHFGLADDVPPIMVEVAVDELLRQAVGGVFHHIVIRRETHAAIGLRLGLLDGVRGRIRRNLA